MVCVNVERVMNVQYLSIVPLLNAGMVWGWLWFKNILLRSTDVNDVAGLADVLSAIVVDSDWSFCVPIAV